jgi:hypothetical protein
MFKKYVPWLVFALLATGSVWAHESIQLITENPPPAPDEDTTGSVIPLSRFEFTLSMAVLVFAVILVLIELYIIKIRRLNGEDAIKFITITLIIMATLFLITAGYSNDQIAPAVGLLGTIAGYLLGKMRNDKTNTEEDA